MPDETHDRRSADGDAVPTSTTAEPAFDVRSDEHPDRCPYCDRPFQRNRYESLHCGLEHFDRLSAREHAAFERARNEEYAAVRRVRLYAIGVLILIYFGLLIISAFVV